MTEGANLSELVQVVHRCVKESGTLDTYVTCVTKNLKIHNYEKCRDAYLHMDKAETVTGLAKFEECLLGLPQGTYDKVMENRVTINTSNQSMQISQNITESF